MKKTFHLAGFCLVLSAIFFSCAAAPQVKETLPTGSPYGAPSGVPVGAPSGAPVIDSPNAGNPPAAVIPPETPTEEMISGDTAPETTELPTVASTELFESGSLEVLGPPAKPWKHPVPEYIMGTGLIKPEDMSDFLIDVNPRVEKEFVENLAFLYAEEAAIEGVNHDTAFAQMCLETGFLRYGGLVTPDMNNFCGLGATGPGVPGNRFPDPRTGVRAHIQHLKAYATDAPLKQELVDPRYHYVRYGSSPAIKGLAGTWAADLLYAEKINNILERLYFFVLGI